MLLPGNGRVNILPRCTCSSGRALWKGRGPQLCYGQGLETLYANNYPYNCFTGSSPFAHRRTRTHTLLEALLSASHVLPSTTHSPFPLFTIMYNKYSLPVPTTMDKPKEWVLPARDTQHRPLWTATPPPPESPPVLGIAGGNQHRGAAEHWHLTHTESRAHRCNSSHLSPISSLLQHLGPPPWCQVLSHEQSATAALQDTRRWAQLVDKSRKMQVLMWCFETTPGWIPQELDLEHCSLPVVHLSLSANRSVAFQTCNFVPSLHLSRLWAVTFPE